ncbi:MAG: sterol desaturase family protein [Stenotrophobium sp.]
MPPVIAGLCMLLPAAVAVYYLTTLMIWVGHWLPHRPGSRLRQFHLGGHHTHYPDSRHARSERFRYGRGRNDSLVPLLPGLAALVLLFWMLLPMGFATVATLELGLIVGAHSYVHLQFHLGCSRLSRYAWFRRAQATHDIHHDRDVNFMVADHFWDRVLGTFERPRQVPA